MSRLECTCGHVITDQTENVPYKATFIRDQDFHDYSDKLTDDISSFINAVKDGKRNEWIKDHFSETYPTDINDSSIVFDIISIQANIFEGKLYQCDNCSRIKIQLQDTNLFASFVPEDDKYKEIFKKFRIQNNVS